MGWNTNVNNEDDRRRKPLRVFVVLKWMKYDRPEEVEVDTVVSTYERARDICEGDNSDPLYFKKWVDVEVDVK